MSLSASSSLRSHSEYLTAFELEAWKAEETQRFREHLQNEEVSHRARWEQDSQTVENERASQFAGKLKQLQTLETRLRQKISELEQRELKLAQTESEISMKAVNFQAQLKRAQEEHSLGLKALASTHGAEISVLTEKLRVAEIRASESDRKLADFENYEGVKNDLKLNNLEIGNLQSKISALVKSRDHFRSALLEVLSKKPEPEISRRPDSEKSLRLARLQGERDALVAGGVCDAEDPLIRALDSEIAELI